MKKLLCVLMVLALLFAIPQPPVWADSISGMNYTVQNGQVTITDYYKSSNDNLAIPAGMNGKPVTRIGDSAFYNSYNLLSVTMYEGMTHIGDYAFQDCTKLYAVVMPEGVTHIGNGAFKGCSRLTSITIPQSVTTIRDEVFHSCYDLAAVTIPKQTTSIGPYAFYNCRSLTELTIPKSVTSIGEGAFSQCSALKTVQFIGDAPQISHAGEILNKLFAGAACTVYYHADTEGWDEQTRQAFGDNLTWIRTEHEYRYGICTICGSTDPQICTHGFAKGVWITEPTCTETGKKSYTCNYCGYVKYVTFPATGHRYENYVCTTCGQRLPGDISGDGNVNVVDVAMLYSHVKGTDLITDEVALGAADYTGDGMINIVDVGKLYMYAKSALV